VSGIFSGSEPVRLGWQSVEFCISGAKFEILNCFLQKRTLLSPSRHFQVQRRWKAHIQLIILAPSYVPIDDLSYAGWNSGGADPQGIEGAPPSFGGWENMRNSARGSSEIAQPQNCGCAHSLLIRQQTKQNGLSKPLQRDCTAIF
jgi:hypothetical protein